MHILLFLAIVPKEQEYIDTFIPASFNGIRYCLHVKKDIFSIQYFLFAVDGVKTINLELYFRKVFQYI